MRQKVTLIAGIAMLSTLSACSDSSTPTAHTDTATMTEATQPTETNALLAEWTGPYGGLPAFDKMDISLIKPALEEGMSRQLAEIEKVANQAEPATFENTIVAMERTGQDLGRVFNYWGIWSGNLSTPEFRVI